eukprot:GHUV01013961.1.p2 GENE.GHUV01013961.1~~GHUV01013961.1.p2  ORF type:complete len:157 (-),score=1.59 GHUV01013961.1:175-645(-)
MDRLLAAPRVIAKRLPRMGLSRQHNQLVEQQGYTALMLPACRRFAQGQQSSWKILTVFGATELHIELADIILHQFYLPIAHHAARNGDIPGDILVSQQANSDRLPKPAWRVWTSSAAGNDVYASRWGCARTLTASLRPSLCACLGSTFCCTTQLSS